MSNLIKQALLLPCRTPLTQFQRYRGKINIQRPQKPHYQRALVIATTQSEFEERPKTLRCFKKTQNPSQIQNPYNDIIAREVHNWLKQSAMVGIFHVNSITQDELFRVRVLLYKKNMHLKSYGKQIITKAVSNTKYEAILSLFDSHHCLVFGSDPCVADLIRITRRVPQLILMAGIVHDTLLSRNEFIAYGQMRGLEAARAELVNTINSAASNVVQHLEAHQNNLVNVLDVYAKGDTSDNSTQSTNDDEQKA